MARSNYKDEETYLAARRRYKQGAAGKAARKRYRGGENGKAAHIRDFNKYAKNHPEKVYAHTLVNRAIKRGLMTRKPCVICGFEITHAHHTDYSKPYDVTWLCHVHHMDEHKLQMEGN